MDTLPRMVQETLLSLEGPPEAWTIRIRAREQRPVAGCSLATGLL